MVSSALIGNGEAVELGGLAFSLHIQKHRESCSPCPHQSQSVTYSIVEYASSWLAPLQGLLRRQPPHFTWCLTLYSANSTPSGRSDLRPLAASDPISKNKGNTDSGPPNVGTEERGENAGLIPEVLGMLGAASQLTHHTITVYFPSYKSVTPQYVLHLYMYLTLPHRPPPFPISGLHKSEGIR